MRNNASDKYQRGKLTGCDTAVIQRRLPCVAALGQGDRVTYGGCKCTPRAMNKLQKTGEQAESRSRPL